MLESINAFWWFLAIVFGLFGLFALFALVLCPEDEDRVNKGHGGAKTVATNPVPPKGGSTVAQSGE